MEKNKPNEAGIYLAKASTCRWWNWIVEVGGEAPWLRVEWAINRMDGTVTRNNRSLIDELNWGPKLHEDDLNDYEDYH